MHAKCLAWWLAKCMMKSFTLHTMSILLFLFFSINASVEKTNTTSIHICQQIFFPQIFKLDFPPHVQSQSVSSIHVQIKYLLHQNMSIGRDLWLNGFLPLLSDYCRLLRTSLASVAILELWGMWHLFESYGILSFWILQAVCKLTVRWQRQAKWNEQKNMVGGLCPWEHLVPFLAAYKTEEIKSQRKDRQTHSLYNMPMCFSRPITGRIYVLSLVGWLGFACYSFQVSVSSPLKWR